MNRHVVLCLVCLMALTVSGCGFFGSTDTKDQPATSNASGNAAGASTTTASGKASETSSGVSSGKTEPSKPGTAPPSTPAEEATNLYAQAHVLWKGGDACSDPALAVHLLDQAIALRPDYADAYMRRGLAYSEMGHDEEAFADLTKAIRIDPKPERYAYRGLGLIRQNNMGGARRDFEQSIKMDSKQYRAWNFRGVLNMMEDKTDAACNDFATGCKNGDCFGRDAAKKQGLCR